MFKSFAIGISIGTQVFGRELIEAVQDFTYFILQDKYLPNQHFDSDGLKFLFQEHSYFNSPVYSSYIF